MPPSPRTCCTWRAESAKDWLHLLAIRALNRCESHTPLNTSTHLPRSRIHMECTIEMRLRARIRASNPSPLEAADNRHCDGLKRPPVTHTADRRLPAPKNMSPQQDERNNLGSPTCAKVARSVRTPGSRVRWLLPLRLPCLRVVPINIAVLRRVLLPHRGPRR